MTERARIATPRPATPKALLAVIVELAKTQGEFERVSVGFPGVVRNGVPETAHNLDGKWRGFPLAERLAGILGKPTRVANDADVHGFAAISGRGVELVITLGTGLGSALFVDGILVPNLEAAHYPFRRGSTYRNAWEMPPWNRPARRDGIREYAGPSRPLTNSSTTIAYSSAGVMPRRSREACRRT